MQSKIKLSVHKRYKKVKPGVAQKTDHVVEYYFSQKLIDKIMGDDNLRILFYVKP